MLPYYHAKVNPNCVSSQPWIFVKSYNSPVRKPHEKDALPEGSLCNNLQNRASQLPLLTVLFHSANAIKDTADRLFPNCVAQISGCSAIRTEVLNS